MIVRFRWEADFYHALDCNVDDVCDAIRADDVRDVTGAPFDLEELDESVMILIEDDVWQYDTLLERCGYTW